MFWVPFLVIKENNCAKLFWNPCINVQVMAQTSSIYEYFCDLTFKCDLDLQPTLRNVSNDTATFQGEQLCQIILKPMHKHRSYGPEKLNLWPFHNLTFKYDLQPNSTDVSNGTSTLQGKQLCQFILKSMHKCTSYGLDKSRWMPTQHTHTPNWSCSNYVSLTASGLEQKELN